MSVSRKNFSKATLFPESIPEAAAFKVNEPDWEKSRTLALRAVKKAESGDFKAAIKNFEEAIKLDSIAALNHLHGLRAQFYTEVGQAFPNNALAMYSHGYQLAHSGRYRDAALAYQEAARIDPFFLWPLNNLAWMLSTNKDRSVCDGAQAVTFALQVCEKSNWNCWAFLGTLAAAYATAGDFSKAAQWQEAMLPLVPQAHRLDAELELRRYQLGQVHIDEGQPPAAGSGDEKSLGEDDVMWPEKDSVRSLRDLFQGAYFETEIDDDGDLRVMDHGSMVVRPAGSGRYVSFSAWLTPHEDVGTDDCLRFVNRINTSIRLLRASYHESDSSRWLVFDHEVPVHGGIAKRTIVTSFKFFSELVTHAVCKLDADRVISVNRSAGQAE
jgi:tetratricopeptide (TPR) repeat protein